MKNSSLAAATIIGVDFSGGLMAGEKIWLARARHRGEGLHLEKLLPGFELPNSGRTQEVVLPALVQWLAGQKPAICGFDFPFSLGAGAQGNQGWTDWLDSTMGSFTNATQMKEALADERRPCDIAARTPFSPLNLRLYRQTYHGLREVIRPLVLQHGARAAPFQEPAPAGLTLLEVCPASLLKSEKLYRSYKGKSSDQRANRELIWDEMAKRSGLTFEGELRERGVENTEGDALDAVLGAICAHRALSRPEVLLPSAQSRLAGGRVYY